ncbi:unnamed protein product [Linum trigynum]|uniref:DUF8204 domain-containing protein n=1 Tax=Linum trigynum TaxID=586398 RepID=A0AAV2CYN6_9ROSI
MEPSKEFDGGGDGGGGSSDDKSKQIDNQKPEEGGGGGAAAAAGGLKGKSCKGYLYYSSVLKSNGRNPRCIGIPRTLPSGTNFGAGRSEHQSDNEKDLNDFYYGCAGYSVYVNGDHSADKEELKTRLPGCIGLELLVNKKVINSSTSAPAPAQHREDGRSESPRPQMPKPLQTPTDDFLARFTRNANLVASGVARNMRRVGNHIKDTVDDIFFPFRRRPK